MPQIPENKFGITGELKDFSQAQYEVFQPLVHQGSKAAYMPIDGTPGLTAVAVVRGATCRAAITAGILTGITEEQIGAMKPPAVRWLSNEIEKHVRSVTTPVDDPN
jgi:hypothetical protein